MVRILLVSLCELNKRRLGCCCSCITSWLVVPLCSRLRARGLPFSATKEQAGKSFSDCLVAWFGLFGLIWCKKSLQIRCPFNPSWIFVGISHPKISLQITNSFFHHRFWNFSTAMAWRDVCIWSKTSADVPRVKSLWSSPPMMRLAVHGIAVASKCSLEIFWG